MELSQLEGVKLALEWIGEYMEVHQFLNVSFWRLQEKCMLQILPPPPPGLYSLDSCESVDLPTEDEIYMHFLKSENGLAQFLQRGNAVG